MQQRETRTPLKSGSVQLTRPSTAQEQHVHTLINISRGGLCFQSNETYQLNEIIALSVNIKQQQIHTANGRICYHNPIPDAQTNHYGISFLDKFIDTHIIRQF